MTVTQMRSLIANRKGMIVNLSAEEKGLKGVQSELESYISSIPLREGDAKIQDWKKEMQKFSGSGEGFIVPTQVCTTDKCEGASRNRMNVKHGKL
jgi:hypothetical protein